MFKYAKTFLDKGIQTEVEAEAPLFSEQAELPQNLYEEPETVIGKNVAVKGTIAFQSLLRIDGTFEGDLESSGKLIVGPEGYVKANLDLKEALIAGKIEGNITVKERLVLRGRAEVRGDITAPLLTIDEGVSIIGQVYVTAPEKLPEDQGF